MLLVLLAYVHAACTFVLIAGSHGQQLDANYFRTGRTWTYTYESEVVFDEVHSTPGGQLDAKDSSLGFKLSADVDVGSIWPLARPAAASGKWDGKLLVLVLRSPKLYRKEKTGFVPVASALNGAHAKLALQWHNGRIGKVWSRSIDDLHVRALLKGVASLLQFQLLDGDAEEVDVSGVCRVRYESRDANTLTKTKRDCTSPDLLLIRNPKPLLSTKVASKASLTYQLNDEYVESVTASELHTSSLAAGEKVGAQVLVKQALRFTKAQDGSLVPDATTGDVAELLVQQGFVEDVLPATYKRDAPSARTFADVVHKQRKQLTKFGVVSSARAFLKCLEAARASTKDEVIKVLTSKSNEGIFLQLLDVLGYVQTGDSHEGVTKVVHFDDANQVDAAERYLWALSFSSQPNVIIMEDLLHKFKNTQNIPEKVRETLISTLAAMARRLNDLHTGHDGKIYNEIQETIVNYLDATTSPGGRVMYLRALMNLESVRTLPLLINLTRNAQLSSKETVLAWRSIKQISTQRGLAEKAQATILAQAERTFLQLDKKEDSSARTISVDILLETFSRLSTVSKEKQSLVLQCILNYLKTDDKDKEVKQYVLQRLETWEAVDEAFGRQMNVLLAADAHLNNYNALAPSGLSVAMQRRVYAGGVSNGTLATVQEVQQGLVKRGIVSIVMEGEDSNMELFGLNIFTGGLGGFLASGDDDAPSDKDDSTATAGMELAVLGTHLRPFVFFSGQGELMGHVWSGTGSERTTAFQALAMLHFHEQVIRLGNGLIVEVDVKSAASFDLAGQIAISLWYRNADSKVEKSAAIYVNGGMRLHSPWMQNAVEYSLAFEPKLELAANVDFSVSTDVKLCLRLQQPTIETTHSVHKIERVLASAGDNVSASDGSPSSENLGRGGRGHRKRVRIQRRSHLPGRTHLLNQKNSEMCNAIYNN